MKLRIDRFLIGEFDVLARMYINDEFACYIYEDLNKNINNGIIIPSGTYKVELLNEGKVHNLYSERFGDWHKGVLKVIDIPQMNIIICNHHYANNLVTGAECNIRGIKKQNNIGGHIKAYKEIYPVIRNALMENEIVTLTITKK